jgi:2-polyprenyl-3-methyl-5-hydroxy-6-metoxy-1,4-benzoquinol methylase
MRYKTKEESHKDHMDNYKSDGIGKQLGNPNQAGYLRICYFVDQIEPGSKVLDVGCNGGTLGVPLLHKDCHVNGIDIVQDLVDKAKRRGIYAEQGVAEDLSRYDDNSFDYVMCGEVLEHLYDPFPAVEEAYRVLKPGGKYIFSVPHPNSFMCTDKLGDYHQQNFTLEILDTMVYSYFKRDSASIVEIPYIDRFNMANGIEPIGQNEDGSPIFPPQWVGVTATKEKE